MTTLSGLTGEQANAADAATDALLVETVAHQSDAYRALDATVKAAAGWNTETGKWNSTEPTPLTIRILENGAVLTTGYQHASDLILNGNAELA